MILENCQREVVPKLLFMATSFFTAERGRVQRHILKIAVAGPVHLNHGLMPPAPPFVVGHRGKDCVGVAILRGQIQGGEHLDRAGLERRIGDKIEHSQSHALAVIQPVQVRRALNAVADELWPKFSALRSPCSVSSCSTTRALAAMER